MRKIVFILSLLLSTTVLAKTKSKYIGVKYYKNIFGHVHQNPSRHSSSLTTVSCGHPIKVYSSSTQSWSKVKVGPHQGYVEKRYLLRKKPKCFQDKYPRFFDQFTLDISELYYWGKLYDQYVQGKSRVR